MKVMTAWCWILGGLAVAVVTLGTSGRAPAQQPEAPPVSKFAPAADLAAQVEEYVDEMEEAVEDEDDFDETQSKLAKDASALVMVAAALGLHDQDNEYKAAAPAIIAAAQKAIHVEDFASAKAAVAEVKEALASSGQGGTTALSWQTKHAPMTALMEAVPLVNTRLKRYIRRDRFDDCAQFSAVIAVIGQGAMPNSADLEGELKDKVAEWYGYCVEMRDSAAALNAACHAEDADAAETAMDALQKSCDNCHAVFNPE